MVSSVENKRDAGSPTSAAGPDSQHEAFAPGLRVEIRDAEWVIKRADLTLNGTHSVLVTGISELVRRREALYAPARTFPVLKSGNCDIVPPCALWKVRTGKEIEHHKAYAPEDIGLTMTRNLP